MLREICLLHRSFAAIHATPPEREQCAPCIVHLGGFAQKVRNATNGSWWYFQTQPTKERVDNSTARSAPEGSRLNIILDRDS